MRANRGLIPIDLMPQCIRVLQNKLFWVTVKTWPSRTLESPAFTRAGRTPSARL